MSYLHVKWDVMKRKDVPKKVKQTPRAPLVLIWDTMRVVTVADSTSGEIQVLSKGTQGTSGQDSDRTNM